MAIGKLYYPKNTRQIETTMTSTEPDKRDAHERRLAEMPVYTSTSMLMVFEPGDLLETDDNVPFQEIKPGDIIVFPSKSKAGVNIVHRVISRTEDGLVTMGDNNPGRDAYDVTPEQWIRLVTARIDRNGRRFTVSRGVAGMRQFRLHRCRYKLLRLGGKVGRLLVPLMFWRRVPQKTKCFGDTVFYYSGGNVIAKKKAGVVRFTSRLWKLLYKIPSETADSSTTNI